MHLEGWYQQPKIKRTTSTSYYLAKIYPISVPKLISYGNTLYFNIVFVDFFHLWKYQSSNLIYINIQALHLLYSPLQLFWNHTDAVENFVFIHTRLNKVGKILIPFQNCYLFCFSGINLWLLRLQFFLCNAWWDASHSFLHNTTSQNFFSWFYAALKNWAELYISLIAHW